MVFWITQKTRIPKGLRVGTIHPLMKRPTTGWRTADRGSNYRKTSVTDDVHPGMFEVDEGGVSVAGEFYRMSEEIWKKVEAGEPPNLYCGSVLLEDGRSVNGILYPRGLAEGKYLDISGYGDWRVYMATKKSAS